MKVAELEGAQLDYWVARALGFPGPDDVPTELCGWEHIEGESFRKDWQPSQDWAQGGPIIEREGVTIYCSGNVISNSKWWAYINAAQTYDGLDGDYEAIGPTPLIAAMRAYVASKFGDEITP